MKARTRRISRPCYDKPNRCPGWAGGGNTVAKDDSRCDNGTIRTRVPEAADLVDAAWVAEHGPAFKHPGVAWWRFGHCTTCNVITLPWMTRKLDPTYWHDRFVTWRRFR